MQHTDDVLQNVTLETHTILLTNVTPVNLIFKKWIWSTDILYRDGDDLNFKIQLLKWVAMYCSFSPQDI